jgi:hypothetical protein
MSQAGQTITLFNSEYELAVEAFDDTALIGLQINGCDLISEPVPRVRSSNRVSLSLGTNELVVAAQDNDGNYAEKRITVIRREPEHLDSRYRLTASQFPVTGELSDKNEGRRINHLMAYELAASPPRFFMLATSDEDERLKDELHLSATRLADYRALLKAGKRMNAELIFQTHTVKDAPGRTVYTQVYSVDTNEKLFTEDIYFEDPDQTAESIRGLVMKIEQRFPLIKAQLSRFEKQLSINAGANQGIAQGTRLLIIRSESDFNQGQILYTDQNPSELIVSEVESDRAQVIVRGDFSAVAVQDGDFVFTR